MNVNYLLGNENEKPLDELVSDGGFVGIFRKIACVGDSLSSGEFQARRESDGANLYFDRFDYSWGQYMARMAGVTVYNFSRGGMTAKEYMENFANNMGYWQRSLAANAYIIALGVNDILNRGGNIGEVSDVCPDDYKRNADTFIGNYAAIIQRYKEIMPEAVFFLVTTPNAGEEEVEDKRELRRSLRKAIFDIAGLFDNTYVIDLYKYAPIYDGEFKKKFFLSGHMAPAGYLLTAKMICSYIDYIIRHNLKKFKTVGLMDYDYDRTKIQ